MSGFHNWIECWIFVYSLIQNTEYMNFYYLSYLNLVSVEEVLEISIGQIIGVSRFFRENSKLSQYPVYSIIMQ